MGTAKTNRGNSSFLPTTWPVAFLLLIAPAALASWLLSCLGQLCGFLDLLAAFLAAFLAAYVAAALLHCYIETTKNESQQTHTRTRKFNHAKN
jgi:hypothetical protein